METTPLDEAPADMAGELAFLEAQLRYREAKRSGDPEALAAAEEAWRRQVRAELTGSA